MILQINVYKEFLSILEHLVKLKLVSCSQPCFNCHINHRVGAKGCEGDESFRPKLILDAWILPKGEHDSWIYEPAWEVIYLLNICDQWNFFSFCENLNTSLNPYKQEERLKAISLLTLHIPWLTRTEFLLTISTQYQLDNWSIILQTNITKTVWQTVRGITNEIFDQALMFGFHPIALFWEKSNIKRIVWLTVRRIKNLIWELKG